MVNYTSSSVGLYAAGGSGDNLAPNNTVKGIEKVWLDSFAYNTASTALMTTSDTLLIGYVPANCRIVDVVAVLPSTFAPTTAAINIGMSYSTAILVSNSTDYFHINTSTTLVLSNVVRLNNVLGLGFNPTSTTTTFSGGTILQQTVQGVYLSLIGANLTAPTSGTIATIIRYV